MIGDLITNKAFALIILDARTQDEEVRRLAASQDGNNNNRKAVIKKAVKAATRIQKRH